MTRGELEAGEPHPASVNALAWIAKQPESELYMWLEAFSSCSIESNRTAEICAETLNRLLTGKPVSDRYLLGLAWTMQSGKIKKQKKNIRYVLT